MGDGGGSDSGSDGSLESEINEAAIETSPLFDAAAHGHVEVVRHLLLATDVNVEKGRYGVTPLMTAALNDHWTIVVMLLDKGAEAVIVDKETGDTCLLLASREGCAEAVVLLLQRDNSTVGVKNKQGQHALGCATSNNHINIVRLLLDHGVDVNTPENDGCTPLMDAVREGYRAMVGLLLDSGADPTLTMLFGNDTAMHMDQNDTVIAQMLVDKGSDVNARTADDAITPLHIAASFGNIDMVRFLMQRGGCIEAQLTSSGMTPWDCAMENYEYDTALLLRMERRRRVWCEAFAMGQHERLGGGSLVRLLEPEVVRMVLKDVGPFNHLQ
jgi:ankyrin repeat protein